MAVLSVHMYSYNFMRISRPALHKSLSYSWQFSPLSLQMHFDQECLEGCTIVRRPITALDPSFQGKIALSAKIIGRVVNAVEILYYMRGQRAHHASSNTTEATILVIVGYCNLSPNR